MPLGVETYDCVYNPVLHYEHTGIWQPECSPAIPRSFFRRSTGGLPSTVLQLGTESDHASLKAFMARKRWFEDQGMELLLYPRVDDKLAYENLGSQGASDKASVQETDSLSPAEVGMIFMERFSSLLA